jgi:hypothetical protein
MYTKTYMMSNLPDIDFLNLEVVQNLESGTFLQTEHLHLEPSINCAKISPNQRPEPVE